MSDALPHVELRAAASAQIAILHRTSWGRRTEIIFWRIPEELTHLEDDVRFETTQSVLLLKNNSKKKNTSYHENKKT